VGRRAEREAAGVKRLVGVGLFAMLLSMAIATSTAMAAGTTITARGSEFGKMLWGPSRQAVYGFERDKGGKSRCYGSCAKAWPPVYTSGRPQARGGARQSRLGTTRRRNGRLQVTYAGKPLYYYVNEGPDEVLCHDVYLNGGLWWAIGIDGKRRP